MKIPLAAIATVAAMLLLSSLYVTAPAQSTSPAFSPNQELPLPLTAGQLPLKFIVRGLEPSIHVDQDGTVYVGSIRGVPGGADMHRWSPVIDPPMNPDGTVPFQYLGQPDDCGILACTLVGVAEGGGDMEIAVGHPAQGNVPNVAVTSQTVAPGETSIKSTDRGDTFTSPNTLSNAIVGEDREWMDAIDENTVFMAVHDAETFNINVFKSLNGGESYFDGFGQAIDPQTMPAAGGVPASNTANVAGSFRVDRSACSSRGNMYSIFVAPDSAVENAAGSTFRSVYVGVSTDAKLGLPVYTFTDHKVFAEPANVSAKNLFPALAVDNSGIVYAVWSDGSNVWLSVSRDQATTWSAPKRVNTGATLGMANIFPWIDADATGHLGIVWFGADRAGDPNDVSTMEPCTTDPITGNYTSTTCMANWANWNVYFAESINGNATSPAFTQYKASDHVNHRGTLSTGGTTGNANRDMGDFFQISFDPQHRAHIAFSDNHKLYPATPMPGNDDPSAQRLIRANYTHQMNATAGIKTAPACTTAPAETGNKLTGAGQLSSGEKLNAIMKNSPLNATVKFDDDSGNIHARSSNGAKSVVFSGSCATASGDAMVNGAPGYTYTAKACDNAEPGSGKDSFTFDLSGPASYAYHRTGTISQGNYQVH